MRTKLISSFVVLLLLAVAAAAGDFLNVKEGLWEMTVTQSGGGMPGMSPDALAKMPPEQRAMVEQMMKQKGMSMSGSTITVKSCVTKDKLAKGAAFAQNRGNCTHSITKSSPTHMEMKMHCESKSGDDTTTTDGTMVVDVLGADNVKGTSHMVIASKGGSKNMDSTFSSKYLGSDCGDIK
jgi:uncharacterized protein DUF3617